MSHNIDRVNGRERVAERLLRSSAEHFYNADVDIDWAAPWERGKRWLPEHRVSLYGTRLWRSLTPEQRIELGKHELISLLSFGIAAEGLLKVWIPEEYGGAGGQTLLNLCLVVEELSRACGGIGVGFAVNALGSFPVIVGGTEEQKKRWLPQIARGEKLISFGLSEKEAGMLRLLATHRGEVVSREKFLDVVWGYHAYPSTRTVDNFIATLRMKFEEDPGNPRHLITVRGAGYRLDP